MTINKTTIKLVSAILNLQSEGKEQDWEFEFADKDRIQEFIEVASKDNLSFPERFAIFSLILASYEDYLSYHEDLNEKLWKEIKKVVGQEKEYVELLNYWSVWNENEGNWFKITSLVRKFLFDKNYN